MIQDHEVFRRMPDGTIEYERISWNSQQESRPQAVKSSGKLKRMGVYAASITNLLASISELLHRN